MGNITIYICRRTVGVAVSNDLVSGLLKITKKVSPENNSSVLCADRRSLSNRGFIIGDWHNETVAKQQRHPLMIKAIAKKSQNLGK